MSNILWMWVGVCYDIVTLFRLGQAVRTRLYQRTGRYPEMRLEIAGSVALVWPEGKKYPRWPEAPFMAGETPSLRSQEERTDEQDQDS